MGTIDVVEFDFFQVDAFTRRPFGGNPAAVVPMTEWPSDEQLQAIAGENNLSETAFFIRGPNVGDPIGLRWFTPALEVDLCGHATLASAHVLFTELTPDATSIRFDTRRSGSLTVERTEDGYAMDFPAVPGRKMAVAPALTEALGVEPSSAYESTKWMAVLPDEAAVRSVRPDMARIAELDCLGVIVTAAGDEVDFVSRFFAPRAGVPEDPVTGSAHCVLAPYWDDRLGRSGAPMTARQVSSRVGDIGCRVSGDRVVLSGQAVTVIRGKLRI